MTRSRTVQVTDLMAVNAGDELHDPANWVSCLGCKRTRPKDIDDCPWCSGSS